MRYQILESQLPEELTEMVEDALTTGWKCQGGISVTALGDDNYLYSQAMVHLQGAADA